MSVYEVNTPTESPAALLTGVIKNNNTTNPPVNSCALSETSQEENGGTTSTIANIPVDVVFQTPKINIGRKQRW